MTIIKCRKNLVENFQIIVTSNNIFDISIDYCIAHHSVNRQLLFFLICHSSCFNICDKCPILSLLIRLNIMEESVKNSFILNCPFHFLLSKPSFNNFRISWKCCCSIWRRINVIYISLLYHFFYKPHYYESDPLMFQLIPHVIFICAFLEF